VGRLSRVRVALALLGATLGPGGCRERAQAVQSGAQVRDLVRQLRTRAERATNLKFKRDVAVELRSRAQVRDYVIHKFDQDVPAAELHGAEAAYKLFGLIPDSLDLRRTMIDLLTEQVAGYYDPDSGALFIPTDQPDPFKVRVVASHELIHALQDQYLPLDSILNQQRQNDRRSAAQAVLEGQATFYQIAVLMPEMHPETLPPHWFWQQREAMRAQQAAMPEFAAAPQWLKETLIFPYLGGADFIGWFVRAHPGREPFGAAMPRSTEQILHPDRYAAGDAPIDLAFTGAPVDSVRYEDGLGEFEISVLMTVLFGDLSEVRGSVYAEGWGGDRYQVLGHGPGGDALVWYTVWDDAPAALRFSRAFERLWLARAGSGRAGYRSTITAVKVGGRPAVRLVYAPDRWAGWARLPEVRIAP